MSDLNILGPALINDQVQGSLIVRQTCEEKNCKGKWNTANAQQLKDEKNRHSVSLALTACSYEDVSAREVHAV